MISEILMQFLENNSNGLSILICLEIFSFLFKYWMTAKNILFDFIILNNSKYFSRNLHISSVSFRKYLSSSPNRNNKLFSRIISILNPIFSKVTWLFFVSNIIWLIFSMISSFFIFFELNFFIVFCINIMILLHLSIIFSSILLPLLSNFLFQFIELLCFLIFSTWNSSFIFFSIIFSFCKKDTIPKSSTNSFWLSIAAYPLFCPSNLARISTGVQ